MAQQGLFEGVTQRLTESIIEIGYDDLPGDVVDKIKLMLLDSIGCALGAYITDRARIALELVEEFGGKPQASVIGGRHTSYALAAFANGELINALDYDYIGPPSGHICPYVTSPCLAIAERQHSSGKDLILALALAHEVGGRALISVAQNYIFKDEPPYYEESPRFSESATIFGGVAGASRLLNLDAERMLNAFGIAGASTAVPAMQKWEYMSGPAIMTKYNCWSGWISQLATVAALITEKGFTGDRAILDGEWGYWKIVGSPFFKPETLLEDLGKVWHIDEVKFKPYPTCAVNHGGIEAINKLVHEHEIKPEEIEEILVQGSPLMMTPNRMGMDLESFADAQFRNSYIFALAAYHGNNPGPSWQLPATFNDARIRALMQKVKIGLHPRASELMVKRIKAGESAFFPNTFVEITAKGTKFSAEVPPKGMSGNLMREEELVDKFRNNASYSILKSDKVEQIIEVIKRLETVTDITELARLLSVT